MARALKKHASKLPYQSVNQLVLVGFETPFSQKLDPDNRWVKLADIIPWDKIVSVYNLVMHNHQTGAGHINGRVVLGALMIKHLCNLSDEDTILNIQENVYMQYFIGFSSFSTRAVFDASLFVEIRKRLGTEELDKINQLIYELAYPQQQEKTLPEKDDDNTSFPGSITTLPNQSTVSPPAQINDGTLLMDASVCPQDIAYPTDLNILNDAREKSEELIDVLHNSLSHGTKPRTYRQKARKFYLKTAQKKNKSKKVWRLANGQQLRYLKRNIGHIHKLLDAYQSIPLNAIQYKYLLVITETYRQQNLMYRSKKQTTENRIVSIHQPHVRPIVRGKAKAKTEFGAKIQLSLVNGFSFLDKLSWENFNEGTYLLDSVELFKKRTGHYPKEVLADKIYCTRKNRQSLKELAIKLKAKPLGRQGAVKTEHVRPGERNPIEGKFGQAKTKYGLNLVKARLNTTSQSWIASIIMVLNLVKLAGQVPLCLLLKLLENLILTLFLKKHRALLFQ